MKKYRGYYIDKVLFNSKEEIDEFIKNKAIEAYKTAVRVFMINMNTEASIYADQAAERLVNQFGFTWSQVEEIEIGVMTSVA